MKGYQFRRQRPVLDYIADFMCKELKLIIEVDGITHHYADTQLNDRIRQKELEKAGFTVLRFKDDDVLTGIDRVTLEIEDWISKVQPPLPSNFRTGKTANSFNVPLMEGEKGEEKV